MGIEFPPNLIGQCQVIVIHDNNWHEPLTITKIEQIPTFNKPATLTIYVKPPLAIVKE